MGDIVMVGRTKTKTVDSKKVSQGIRLRGSPPKSPRRMPDNLPETWGIHTFSRFPPNALQGDDEHGTQLPSNHLRLSRPLAPLWSSSPTILEKHAARAFFYCRAEEKRRNTAEDRRDLLPDLSPLKTQQQRTYDMNDQL